MASTIKVDKIEGSTGSTITVPTGQTLTVTDGLAPASLQTVTVAKGGTNLTSFAAGDVLYATGSTTLAKLAKGSAADVLTMNSGATAPEWAASAGGGKVLQCLVGFDHTDRTHSSTSFSDFSNGSKVTITPSATTSKILVFGGFGYYKNSDGYLYTTLYRDSTELSGDADGISKSYSHADGGDSTYVQYLDSPSSTSALVYSLSIRLSNTPTVYINCNYLTCLEIGV